MNYEIYTDGSCRGNPGPGGWGVLIKNMESGEQEILRGGNPQTTNNIMELTAIIRALEEFEVVEGQSPKIKIYSDSQYCIQSITEWMDGWIKNGWKSSTKKPVKNDDLWKEYVEVSKSHKIIASWVKGHAGHEENERCDALARLAIELQSPLIEEIQ